MSTVKQTLRNLPLSPQKWQDLALVVNREIVPVIREAVQRFNERHGTTVITASDYTVADPVETVIATAAITVTLPAVSGWKRYLTLVANGGNITIATAGSDTNNGPSSVTSTGLAILVPDGDNAAWYGG